ncbi:MAG: hypothetical protein K6B28_13755 [Lachnospiraceae bacterium]|nr:hypothetical protein [Lachnospiraceae bacterium]
MSFTAKGEKGYIAKNRKRSVIRTLIMFALAVGIYLLGLLTMGTNKNVWTIIAVLSMLPASKSAVNMIMFLRVKKPQEELYRETEEAAGELYVLYDLVFTTYERTYQSDAMVLAAGNMICYSSGMDADKGKFEEYLNGAICKGRGYSVKVYTDKDEFLKRIASMREHFSKELREPEEIVKAIRSIVL